MQRAEVKGEGHVVHEYRSLEDVRVFLLERGLTSRACARSVSTILFGVELFRLGFHAPTARRLRG